MHEDSGQDQGGDGLVGGNNFDDNNLCVADLVLASLPGGSSVACSTKHLSDKSLQAHYILTRRYPIQILFMKPKTILCSWVVLISPMIKFITILDRGDLARLLFKGRVQVSFR